MVGLLAQHLRLLMKLDLTLAGMVELLVEHLQLAGDSQLVAMVEWTAQHHQRLGMAHWEP